MTVIFRALDPDLVAALRAGGPDSFGMAPERAISDGGGNPCRHCLDDIPEGAGMLILAHRPFPALQPYAETGPIFLCAACAHRAPDAAPPPAVASRPAFLVKGYDRRDRIRYGTGRVTPAGEIPAYCARLFEDPEVAYVHLRSAVNNCYICRVDRA